jgi:hypothetical protein
MVGSCRKQAIARIENGGRRSAELEQEVTERLNAQLRNES